MGPTTDLDDVQKRKLLTVARLEIQPLCCPACSQSLYRLRDCHEISRGPGSIPGATRFSEKQCVWNGVHSASWAQLKSYLKEKAAPVYKIKITAVGYQPRWLRDNPLSAKIGTNFADKWRSLGIVFSRTQAKEFVLFVWLWWNKEIRGNLLVDLKCAGRVERHSTVSCPVISCCGSAAATSVNCQRTVRKWLAGEGVTKVKANTL
jgi:hypothetical protein